MVQWCSMELRKSSGWIYLRHVWLAQDGSGYSIDCNLRLLELRCLAVQAKHPASTARKIEMASPTLASSGDFYFHRCIVVATGSTDQRHKNMGNSSGVVSDIKSHQILIRIPLRHSTERNRLRDAHVIFQWLGYYLTHRIHVWYIC